ncbi:MAG: NAD-dependent epimerase/dehydratase family protein [Alphaproteobacteria bacterium]|nr:NAD-dependent epimerase/dehydratase family protein [Alphaproteobacteria bacterium]MCB9792825.1 NAD-dependent epimerase/dehydratase family protein [Alphaproteobacteria bacterium]
MNIFLTGGSGFVGGHLIESLSQRHRVFAMARSEASAAKVEALGATAVRCDLETVSAEQLAGMQAVVHAAAYVEEHGPREVFERINVGGTQRLLDAARAAGVGRFVQVSSNAAVFDTVHQLDVDEALAYPEHPVFPYADTKAEAERRVLAADAPGFTTVAIRPCFVWGTRDNSVLPALKRMAEEGSFAWIGGGRPLVSTTHVDNLVEGVRCALETERGGQAYFVADEDDLSLRAFLGGLAEASGVQLPERSLPAPVVAGAAWLVEQLWSLLGRRDTPSLTRMAVALMSTAMTVRTDKARAELGWRPVMGREAGLAELARAERGEAAAA